MIVVLEQKMVLNTQANDCILTVLGPQQKPLEKFLFQHQFQNTTQEKSFCIDRLNNADSIGIYIQSFSQTNAFEFIYWNVLKNFSLKEVKFSTTITSGTQVQKIGAWGADKMCVIGNYNEGDTPYILVADISKLREGENLIQNEQKLELNVIDKIHGSWQWTITGIYYLDYNNQKFIWERLGDKGTYLGNARAHFTHARTHFTHKRTHFTHARALHTRART